MNVQQEEEVLRQENEDSSLAAKFSWSIPLDVTSLLIKKATSSGDNNCSFDSRHDEIIDWTQTAPPPCLMGGMKDDHDDLTQADINLLVTTLSQLSLGGSGSGADLTEECKGKINNNCPKNSASEIYLSSSGKCRSHHHHQIVAEECRGPSDENPPPSSCGGGHEWMTSGNSAHNNAAELSPAANECQSMGCGGSGAGNGVNCGSCGSCGSTTNEWPVNPMMQQQQQQQSPREYTNPTTELHRSEEIVSLSYNGGGQLPQLAVPPPPPPVTSSSTTTTGTISNDEKERRISFLKSQAWSLVPGYVEDEAIFVFGKSLQLWRELLIELVFSDPFTLECELQKGNWFGFGQSDKKTYHPAPHITAGGVSNTCPEHLDASYSAHLTNDNSTQGLVVKNTLIRNCGGTFPNRFTTGGGGAVYGLNHCRGSQQSSGNEIHGGRNCQQSHPGLSTQDLNARHQHQHQQQQQAATMHHQQTQQQQHQRTRGPGCYGGMRNTSATATSTASTATPHDDYQHGKSRRSTSEAWGTTGGAKNGGTPNKGCMIPNMVRPPPSEGRFKQIARGKSTPEYLEYIRAVPRELRIPDVDPVTPRVEGSSWREFQAEVRAWKRSLHRKYEALEAQKRKEGFGF